MNGPVVRGSAHLRSISIIVPAYNEAGTIVRVVDALADADLGGLIPEIIVVDDGSSDDTAERARTAFADLQLSAVGKVIVLPVNQGKTAALKAGFAASTGDLVIVQDADLEYDPADIALLLRPLLANRADVVVGSRFIGGHPRRLVYLSNALGNRLMSVLFSVVSGLRLTDVHCCYIVLPGDLIRAVGPQISSERWGFNPEICSLLADWRTELRIVEVGISYYGRSKAEGKKIRFHHGVIAVAEIVKFNVRRRRPLP
jgi:glycosyltransferase involved in cell wall biosynthesis